MNALQTSVNLMTARPNREFHRKFTAETTLFSELFDNIFQNLPVWYWSNETDGVGTTFYKP
jgi:hypothetical protein